MEERFVLTEMVLRGTKFVPARDASSVEMDWNGLCAALAPKLDDRMKLRMLRPHDIIGLKRSAFGGLANFYLSNADRTGNVTWLLKKQPLAFEGLEKAYRVDVAQYAYKIQEAS